MYIGRQKAIRVWAICLVLISSILSTAAIAKSIVTERFQSRPWHGKALYDASGRGFQECGIWADYRSGDSLGFWLTGDGQFGVAIHNKQWQLPESFTFDSIAFVDRSIRYDLRGRRTAPTQISFDLAHTIEQIEIFRKGSLFQLSTPFGPKGFPLTGTRKALNLLIECRARHSQKRFFADSYPDPIPDQSTAVHDDEGMEILVDIDLFGGDYRRLKRISFDSCKSACNAQARCKAFTYNQRNSWCFLKHQITQQKPFSGAISGIKGAVDRPPRVRNHVFQHRHWAGGPAYDDSGELTGCQIKTDLGKNASFHVVLLRNHQIQLGVSKTDWKLSPGKQAQGVVTIDKAPPIFMPGSSVLPTMIAVKPPDKSLFERLFTKGRRLELLMPGVRAKINLAGSSAALERLYTCVRSSPVNQGVALRLSPTISVIPVVDACGLKSSQPSQNKQDIAELLISLVAEEPLTSEFRQLNKISINKSLKKIHYWQIEQKNSFQMDIIIFSNGERNYLWCSSFWKSAYILDAEFTDLSRNMIVTRSLCGTGTGLFCKSANIYRFDQRDIWEEKAVTTYSHSVQTNHHFQFDFWIRLISCKENCIVSGNGFATVALFPSSYSNQDRLRKVRAANFDTDRLAGSDISYERFDKNMQSLEAFSYDEKIDSRSFYNKINSIYRQYGKTFTREDAIDSARTFSAQTIEWRGKEIAVSNDEIIEFYISPDGVSSARDAEKAINKHDPFSEEKIKRKLGLYQIKLETTDLYGDRHRSKISVSHGGEKFIQIIGDRVNGQIVGATASSKFVSDKTGARVGVKLSSFYSSWGLGSCMKTTCPSRTSDRIFYELSTPVPTSRTPASLRTWANEASVVSINWCAENSSTCRSYLLGSSTSGAIANCAFRFSKYDDIKFEWDWVLKISSGDKHLVTTNIDCKGISLYSESDQDIAENLKPKKRLFPGVQH